MTTAIIGTGNIGGTLARHLVRGGEPVVLAAKDEANATALAQELGELARAASVEEAIADADAVVFAVWLADALSPLRKHLTPAAFDRLVFAIAATTGIEAFIWLTDMAGLSAEEALKIMRFSAQTLLDADSP